MQRFVTLSPIPGFRRWLERELAEGLLSDRERDLLPAEPSRVRARLADEDWDADEAIKPALLALCARYLTTRHDNRVEDPVANFHYANGAALEQINWLADPSPSGRSHAAGLMTNYLVRTREDRDPRRALCDIRRSRLLERDQRAARRIGCRPWRSSST